MYDHGYGVPRDDSIAVARYTKAAEQGEIQALKIHITLYFAVSMQNTTA